MITIDPGLNGCGVAFWGVKELQAAYYLPRNSRVEQKPFGMAETLRSAVESAMPVERIIIEKPQIYPSMPVPSDDLLNLHEMSSIFVGLLGRTVEWVRPREWKGSVRKEIMTNRLIAIMDNTDENGDIVLPTAKSLQHNVYDAIGIGLWALGRLDRKRVYPR